jgi:hypothetical protein
VFIKASTTVNADKKSGLRTRTTEFRKDKYGYNVVLEHYLCKLACPDFRKKVEDARQSVYRLRAEREARRNLLEASRLPAAVIGGFRGPREDAPPKKRYIERADSVPAPEAVAPAAGIDVENHRAEDESASQYQDDQAAAAADSAASD